MKKQNYTQATMTCEKALSIATKAHFGQVDKQGVDYIKHPKRVGDKLTGDAQIVGYLHDVLEDTEVTIYDLKKDGLNRVQTLALLAVTRTDDVTYKNFIQSIISLNGEAGKIARMVKIEDLLDNMSRPVKSLESMISKRYVPALEQLRQAQQDRNELVS